MEGLRGGGGARRGLGDHVLLQQLHRDQEGLLSLAVSLSPTECLILLPEEAQLRGYQIDRVFLETHVLQGTAYPNVFVNLRGQEVERNGDELVTSLGFRSKVSVSILREERMFEAGAAFCCLLISSPLLPLPAGRRSDGGPTSGPVRKQQGPPSGEGAPSHGPLLSGEEQQQLASPSCTETQLRVERLWKQGPQGPTVERLVHAEISRFKGTYVLVPGFDAALAQRLAKLTAACCRHIPASMAPPREAQRLMERFVWLEVHDRLWPFFLETAEAKQAAVERGLSVVRADPVAAVTDVGIRRELRSVRPLQTGRELTKLSSLLLPHEKLQQLSVVFQSIYSSCDEAVSVASWRAPLGGRKAEPVEVACEDLVALLLLAMADSGGAALVASYLHMSVLLLQQSREVRFEREAFYLTVLHTALTVASKLQPESSEGKQPAAA
ncbi:hypothetical protein Efla_003773 [Eimeria flavescens]